MIGNILKGIGKARSVTAASLDALDALREAIAERRQELAVLQRAPLPVSEALRRFDAWADQAATAAVDGLDLGRLLDPQAQGDLRLPLGPRSGDTLPDTRPAVEALFGLIALACRDQLRQTIAGQLGDLVHDRETLTDGERRARIAEVEAQIKQAEALEERAVRELEGAGVAVARRADADPAIVLLADTTLAKIAG